MVIYNSKNVFVCKEEEVWKYFILLSEIYFKYKFYKLYKLQLSLFLLIDKQVLLFLKVFLLYLADRNEVPLYDNQVQAGSCVDKKGNKRQGGEKWTEGCRNCLCGGNKVYCEALKCPVPECDNPVSSNEKCCPYCPGLNFKCSYI